MQKLCFFYKNLFNIQSNILSSFLMMSTWVILFYILFFSKINSIKEFLYPIVSIPLTLYTIVFKNEPSLIIYFVAIFFWLMIVFSSTLIDFKYACRIQNIYIFISLFLAFIVMIGKNF